MSAPRLIRKFPEVYEKRTPPSWGRGVCLNKYTGTRGKSGTNDANAEFIAKVLGIFEGANICFQTAELGKVDQGGGGTIAYMCALYGMEVLDAGPAVLSMHAPGRSSTRRISTKPSARSGPSWREPEGAARTARGAKIFRTGRAAALPAQALPAA